MPSISRRQTLAFGTVGLSGLALAGGAPLARAAATPPANACILMPQAVEGPYYLDARLQRVDVTEGRPGIPLALQLRILGADCAPIQNARVDLWHCDAQGVYSGFDSGKGQTFLRGTQFADAAGDVAFATLYPGWYHGRTTHMHYKVFLDTKTVLTGQIFLPDALSEFIYGNVEAYRRDDARDTLNALDGIAKMATDASQALIKEQRTRYVASLTVAVDPNAAAMTADLGPGGPGGPPPGMPFGPPPDGRPPGPPPGVPGGPGGPPVSNLSPAERLKALIPGPDRPDSREPPHRG